MCPLRWHGSRPRPMKVLILLTSPDDRSTLSNELRTQRASERVKSEGGEAATSHVSNRRVQLYINYSCRGCSACLLTSRFLSVRCSAFLSVSHWFNSDALTRPASRFSADYRRRKLSRVARPRKITSPDTHAGTSTDTRTYGDGRFDIEVGYN